MVTLTLQVSTDLASELSTLAESTGRSQAFLLEDALAMYLKREEWQITEIRKGLREAENGEFASAERVDTLCKKWGYHAG